VRWRAKDGDEGTLSADIVVNCAGQWARALGRLAGVTVPLHSAEHYYVVTAAIAGVARDMPVLRDPDGYIYFKEEVGGLVMGGFEPDATPWGMNGIPEPFEFQLLPDNWEAFEILMTNALQRVPAMETTEIKQFVNGPESFTPDNHFILGEAPELRGFYVGAGFNSMGIASAGGAGMALAEWIVEGEPTMDLWPVDIRRFARFNSNDRWLHDRVRETLGLHYRMPWPNRELESARPFRRSPLYAHLERNGARFGSKMGWERPNYFESGADPNSDPRETELGFYPRQGADPDSERGYTFGQPRWLEWSGREHRACRENVALFDMSSFAKFAIKGRDAEAVLQAIAANDVAVPAGRTVYTGLLNERGGYESDCTLTRVRDDEYLLVTGSAQATRDFAYIERLIPESARCAIVDVTGMLAVLAVMGPRSRELLQSVSRADWSNAGFPFGTSRDVDIGYATVRATRLTYVGELGWELYVPVELAVGVYETLHDAGRAFGLADAGYYAIDSLRIEKGYRAWGRELTPERNPFEAGCRSRASSMRRRVPRPRCAAARAQRRDPALHRVADDRCTRRDAVGGEAVLRDGEAGRLRHLGGLWSHAGSLWRSRRSSMARRPPTPRDRERDATRSTSPASACPTRMHCARASIRRRADPGMRRPTTIGTASTTAASGVSTRTSEGVVPLSVGGRIVDGWRRPRRSPDTCANGRRSFERAASRRACPRAPTIADEPARAPILAPIVLRARPSADHHRLARRALSGATADAATDAARCSHRARAARPFGITSTRCTSTASSSGGRRDTRVWIARRSTSKSIDPGCSTT
jgi:4-methylaminobutanoate oxidase (formaldehyde-forming)